jgi:hypothetical protein
MGGGGGSDSSRRLVLDIAQNKLSPQQRKEAIHNMQHAVFSQGISELAANPWLAMTYTRDLEYAAQKLGIKMPDVVSSTFNETNGPEAHADAVRKAQEVKKQVQPGARTPGAVNINTAPFERTKPGQPQAGVVVQTPGGPQWFETQQQADQFKAAVGIK